MAYNNVKVKARQVVSRSNTQTKDLGTVSEVPMGEWDATTLYKKLNLVRYNGATYIATQDNQGVAPTGSGIWQLVSRDGRGVQKYAVTYQAGLSGTVPPNNEWVSEVPDVPQGQYLWSRTVITYTDGTQSISYSVSLQGLNFTQQDRDDVDRILEAIPSSASKDNPLTTKDFVNSSINAMAAFYVEYNAQGDAFPTRAALLNATVFYNAGQPRIPTQNDYAYVLSDESQPKDSLGNYPTTRYSYQGGMYPNGQWGFQYIVNNTSLTQAQVDAINSGITAELVEQIGKNAVTGVKGNQETQYRTGNVNLTSQNIGAVDKSGDTMTGILTVEKSTYPSVQVKHTATGYTGFFEHSGVGLNLINRDQNGNTLAYMRISNGQVTARASLYENDQRVYSPNNPPPYEGEVIESTFITGGQMYNTTGETNPMAISTRMLQIKTSQNKSDFYGIRIDGQFTDGNKWTVTIPWEQLQRITTNTIIYGTESSTVQYAAIEVEQIKPYISTTWGDYPVQLQFLLGLSARIMQGYKYRIYLLNRKLNTDDSAFGYGY